MDPSLLLLREGLNPHGGYRVPLAGDAQGFRGLWAAGSLSSTLDDRVLGGHREQV